MTSRSDLTIGIVVYNEVEEIQKSLQQLQSEINHHISDRQVHWIFVFNHSSEDIRAEILEKIKEIIPRFSYFSNFENNLGFARNLILNKCQTDLLYFTDPDIEHPHKSLSVLLQLADLSHSNPSLIGFTGPVLHKSESRTMNDMFSILQRIAKKIPFSFQIQNHSFLNTVDHAPTCHLLLIKNRALHLGGFSEQIPSVGEDLDFSHRVFSTEMRFLFSPQSHVLHHQNLKLKKWLRKVLFFGRAQIMVHKKNSNLPIRFYRLIPLFFSFCAASLFLLPITLQLFLISFFIFLFFLKRSLVYLFLTLITYSFGELAELVWPELKLKQGAQQKIEQIELVLSSEDTRF